MPTAHTSVAINAPADKVFETLVDWRSYPQWFTGVSEVGQVTGDPHKPGTEGSFTYQVLGLKLTQIWTVETAEASSLIRNRMSGAFPGNWEWALEPQTDGVTKVTGVAEYSVPGGVLGKVANQLLLERMNQRNIASTGEALKVFCEA